MYAFFTLFGFLFVTISSILINYIYKIFSINKITNFFNPVDGKTVINEINITVLPTIVWCFIEIPILGNNSNFMIATILNIIVACAILYEIKYGLYLIINKDKNLINIIAIIVAVFLGQLVSFMILKSNPIIDTGNFGYLISILGVTLLFIIHAFIILQFPNLRIKKEKEYEKKR